jgi:hypothetical protein
MAQQSGVKNMFARLSSALGIEPVLSPRRPQLPENRKPAHRGRVDARRLKPPASVFVLCLFLFCPGLSRASNNRSSLIFRPEAFGLSGYLPIMALDVAHKQIFTAWWELNRIDVLSTVDYHLIRSIQVLSPYTVDISPDGSTIAVASGGSYIEFFSTSTYEKTNEAILPGTNVECLVYTAMGDLVVQATVNDETTSSQSTITGHWSHLTNAVTPIDTVDAFDPYVGGVGLSRSSDYSVIAAGISGSVPVFLDGKTAQPLTVNQPIQSVVNGFAYEGYFGAASKEGSRYEVCAGVAGYSPSMLILDASGDTIYQDQNGCGAETFSSDGKKLYRDTVVNNKFVTQAIDMTTFNAKSVVDYLNQFGNPSSVDIWQAADATGMVYGVNPNLDGIPSWLAMDMASNSPIPIFNPNTQPVAIVRLLANAGSPNGGDTVALLVAGVDDYDLSDVTVKIGPAPATLLGSSQVQQLGPYSVIAVTTPPGKPGLADVTIETPSGNAVASKAFEYTNPPKIYSFPTSPSFLLFDGKRQLLYAVRGAQVEVIDPVKKIVLRTMAPIGGSPKGSRFAGISLSPDGDRLWIANAGANLIHMIDLAKAGEGLTIDPAKAIGVSTPLSPGRVFEMSNGQILGSDEGPLPNTSQNAFLIDPSTKAGGWVLDPSGSPLPAQVWSTTGSGDSAVLVGAGSFSTSPADLGVWSVNSGAYAPVNYGTSWVQAALTNQDGTVIGAGGDPAFALLIDPNLNLMGTMMTADVTAPGNPTLLFHPSGALLYQGGVSGSGYNSNSGVVDIEDVRSAQLVASVLLPEPFPPAPACLCDQFPLNYLAIDPTGQYIFAITQSGITQMELDTAPLSIGNLQPSFVAAGGQPITIRGSGFQKGAVVRFGGKSAATEFVDADTLTATAPELAPGWVDVSVALRNGSEYKAAGLLHVIGSQPVPVLKSISPSAFPIIPALTDNSPVLVSLIGSGFANNDTVLLNGQPVESSFISAGKMQAPIPPSLTSQTGSVQFSVVSPYTGASNPLSLPMVNPTPAIQSTLPATLPLNGGDTTLYVFGTGFQSNSVIRLNGRPLPTTSGYAYGIDMYGLIATVPANQLENPGSASVTVLNQKPGGGASKPVTLAISAPEPSVAFPASIDLGITQKGQRTYAEETLQNFGSADYTISSIKAEGPGFSATSRKCSGLAPGERCFYEVDFLPSTTANAAGKLVVTDNMPGSPHTIPLTGTSLLPLPVVNLEGLDALGQTVAVYAHASAQFAWTTATSAWSTWIEYSTDPTFKTYSTAGVQKFQGFSAGIDQLGLTTSGLQAGTHYAARIAVQTAAGIARSNVRLFATQAAQVNVWVELAPNAPNSITISPGQSATFSLLVSDGGNGWIGKATLGCTAVPGTPLPAGSTCTVNPTEVSIGQNWARFTLKFSTTSSTPPQTYGVSPVATADGISFAQQQQLTVIVN